MSTAGLLVRDDRERRDDARFPPRAEEPPERERREEVAVRDEERLSEKSPARPRGGSPPAVPRIVSSNDHATGTPPYSSPTAARSVSARWWAFTTKRSAPSARRWSKSRKRIGRPPSGRSGFGVASVAGRKRVPKPAARTRAITAGKTMSCGSDGIRRSRLHPEGDVRLGDEVALSETPSSSARARTAASVPSISAKRPSGVSSTTTTGRAGSREPPRRPALLVAEATARSRAPEERDDRVRAIRRRLQLEATLDAPDDRGLSLVRQERAALRRPEAEGAARVRQACPTRRRRGRSTRLRLFAAARAERDESRLEGARGPRPGTSPRSRGVPPTSIIASLEYVAVPRYRLSGVRARAPRASRRAPRRAAPRRRAGRTLRLRPRPALARRAAEARPLLRLRRRVRPRRRRSRPRLAAPLTLEDAPPPRAPELLLPALDPKARVAVVGTGPAGLFAALALVDAGVPVTILERGDPAEDRYRKVMRFWTVRRFRPGVERPVRRGGRGDLQRRQADLRQAARQDRRRPRDAPPVRRARHRSSSTPSPTSGPTGSSSSSGTSAAHLLERGATLRYRAKVVDLVAARDRRPLTALVLASGEEVPCRRGDLRPRPLGPRHGRRRSGPRASR